MPSQAASEFDFIDLFAGIGGLRLGLESIEGECVFSSEWDKFSQQTYKAWYGETPAGDINAIDPASIPDHHILAAGFPCQPFSIAGVSKKISLGRAHGFADVKQGNLFFSLAAVIDKKRPAVILLENVKNLRSHDRGRTWTVIADTLNELDYEVHAQIIDASGWVPQHRERIFIVGFNRDVFSDAFPDGVPFAFPTPPHAGELRLRDILDKKVDPKYTLSNKLWAYLQNYALKHKAKGNGFGFGLPDLNGVSRTLSARYHKDGSEILIRQPGGKNPRRLSPVEAGRLMGFPMERLEIVVSDTQAYRQFGNAVVPKVAEAVSAKIREVLMNAERVGVDWRSPARSGDLRVAG